MCLTVPPFMRKSPGLWVRPLLRQLAQAADHQLRPRSQQVVEALRLQLGQ
jgi:hypothetical protein